MRVLGIDGWRGGWVGVVLGDDGGVERCCVSRCTRDRYDPAEEPLQALLQVAGTVDAVAIDVPIGLVERGKREAEEQARLQFGLGSSVFWSPPCSAVLDAESQADATLRAHKLDGPGSSAQFWAIRPRVVEARAVAAQRELVEVHPEVCFRLLASELNQDIQWAKKRSWAGMHQRLELLAAVGIDLGASDAGEAGIVPADDLIDAAAAAWTARRVARQDRGLVRLGKQPDAAIASLFSVIVA